MNDKEKPRLVLIDLLGLTAHSNFLTSLYMSCHSIVSQVCATENAIDWDRVLPGCSKKRLYLSTGSFLKYSTWLYILFIFTCRKKNILITGCTSIWHLIIVIFASPNKVNIMAHNEFLKMHAFTGIGSKFLKCIFYLYRLRKFKVAVMSNVMRNTIIKHGLYPYSLLHVVTHPLPDTDTSVHFSTNGAVNLLGLLRPQKLNGAEVFFSELIKLNNTKIRVFGKYTNFEDVSKLQPYCDDFEVQDSDYSSASEREFLSRHDCYGIIFCPNEKYDLRTSGSVIDAVRLGCYCLMPHSSDMALELIGPLVINDLAERFDDPKMIIKDLIKKRKEENFIQINNMFIN
jgi:hypothetical protein